MLNQSATTRSRSITRCHFFSPPALLLYVALGKFLIHCFTNGAYGFHRDELYYIICGEKLSWGYVDHPPLTPVLARVATTLFGYSVAGLRVFPAFAGACMVLLTGMIAQQLGGGRFAQVLAALTVLVAPVFLLTNTLFQTVTFDQLWWVVGTYLLLRLLNGADQRLWLLVGGVMGVGLLTKYTVLVFGFGIVGGLLLTPARVQLRSRWLWLGGSIALLLAAPNLAWQMAHGFPTLEFLANNNATVQAAQPRWLFLLLQLPYAGVFTFWLMFVGLYALFTLANHRYHALGWLCVIVYAVLIITNGKAYYAAPVFPLLFAAGAVWMEQRVVARPRWRWSLISVAMVNGLVAAIIMLPIMPVAFLAQHRAWYPHEEFAEMIGWPELAATIDTIYHHLPADERARTTILTNNYGEASAITIFGQMDGLPRAISGQNSYYLWGPDTMTGDVTIAVGFQRAFLEQYFAHVQQVSAITNASGVKNKEYQRLVFVCRGITQPLHDLWPQFKQYR